MSKFTAFLVFVLFQISAGGDVTMANKLILEGLTENELQKYFIRQNIENIPFQQGSSEQTLDTCKTNFVKCIS